MAIRLSATLAIVAALMLFAFRPHAALSSVGAVPAAQGGSVQLFANDRAVALLFTTAECPVTRLHTRWYRELGSRLRREGIAFRAVVRSSPGAAAQLAAPWGESATVVLDDGGLSARGAVQATPTLRLYDAGRRLTAEWVTPTSGAVVDSLVRDAGVRLGPDGGRTR